MIFFCDQQRGLSFLNFCIRHIRIYTKKSSLILLYLSLITLVMVLPSSSSPAFFSSSSRSNTTLNWRESYLLLRRQKPYTPSKCLLLRLPQQWQICSSFQKFTLNLVHIVKQLSSSSMLNQEKSSSSSSSEELYSASIASSSSLFCWQSMRIRSSPIYAFSFLKMSMSTSFYF